jgi:hypothetical protein
VALSVDLDVELALVKLRGIRGGSLLLLEISESSLMPDRPMRFWALGVVADRAERWKLGLSLCCVSGGVGCLVGRYSREMGMQIISYISVRWVQEPTIS